MIKVENIRLKKIGTQDEIANDPGIGRNLALEAKGLIQGKNRGGGMSNGANPTDPLSYLRGISGVPPLKDHFKSPEKRTRGSSFFNYPCI